MPGTVQLRLMSFNIQHGKGLDGTVNLNRTVEVLKQTEADVIGLQEVDRFVPRSGLQDQARRLAEALDMHWCYSPSLKLGFMEYGNLILSRYPIVTRKVVYMRGFGERRSIVVAGVRLGDWLLHVVNTHLGLLPSQRRKQMPVLLQTLSGIEGPAVLLGDFNMAVEHRLLGTIARVWHRLRPHNHQATSRSGGEIDHIFTSMPVMHANTRVEPTTASDHHPVVSEIRFSSEERDAEIV